MQCIPFSTAAQPFPGILLDAYGVFWGGNQRGPLPHTPEAMKQLVAQGKIVGILSNSTQLASKEITKLATHGLNEGEHFHFLLTSGTVARQFFQEQSLPFPTPNKKYWLFTPTFPQFSSHLAIFEGTPYQEAASLSEADFIYITVPHLHGFDQTDPRLFEAQTRQLVQTRLPMVCTNPDHFAQEGDPVQVVVRQGSIAALYKALGGTVFYIGKPFPLAYAAAMRAFTTHGISDPKHILMLGDTPETDVWGANQCGMSSALVTETGLIREKIREMGWDGMLQTLTPQTTPRFFVIQLAS